MWIQNKNFLSKVIIFANFCLEVDLKVIISLDFLIKVMIFANFGLKVANFLRFSV